MFKLFNRKPDNIDAYPGINILIHEETIGTPHDGELVIDNRKRPDIPNVIRFTILEPYDQRILSPITIRMIWAEALRKGYQPIQLKSLFGMQFDTTGEVLTREILDIGTIETETHLSSQSTEDPSPHDEPGLVHVLVYDPRARHRRRIGLRLLTHTKPLAVNVISVDSFFRMVRDHYLVPISLQGNTSS